MKNRFFLAIAAIMVTGALLLPATAQNNNIMSAGQYRVSNAVYLSCSIHQATEGFSLTITNNTNQTIPAGTKINWQGSSLMKGSFVLSAPLAPGKYVYSPTVENTGNLTTPKAWYLK